jgi:hypothetical protein
MGFPRPNPNNKHADTYAVIIWLCVAIAVISHFAKC